MALIKKHAITKVIGGDFQELDGGTTILVGHQFGGGSGTSANPFEIDIASATTITVRYGQVNNITPTINGDVLDNTDPPELTVNTEGTNNIYLKCTLNKNGDISAIEVDSIIGPVPDQDFAPGKGGFAYLNLGNVVVDSTPKIAGTNQSIYDSQSMFCCGATPVFGAA